MQARYYDPSLGRFLSIDAAGFDDSNPQSFNSYAYANNNPHRYVDPDGNVFFLAPFVYSAATFIAKEVAVAVVSHYVPAVRYVGTKNLLKFGVEATGSLAKRALRKNVIKGADSAVNNATKQLLNRQLSAQQLANAMLLINMYCSKVSFLLFKQKSSLRIILKML